MATPSRQLRLMLAATCSPVARACWRRTGAPPAMAASSASIAASSASAPAAPSASGSGGRRDRPAARQRQRSPAPATSARRAGNPAGIVRLRQVSNAGWAAAAIQAARRGRPRSAAKRA